MSKPRQLHRVLSVLLCLCMLAGMLPAYALAADSKAAGSSELTKGSSIEGTDYSVTSLKNYAIAPDISEKVIITNNAAGNSQTVANVMEVNTAGGRAKIVAGYGNRNPKEQGWTLKTTTDQAHVYEKETGLNVVGGVNASWFNINTGEPSGYLVMNGVVHHDNSSRAFIAAFDDGSVNVFREGTTLAQAEADQSAKQGKTVKILEAVDALVAMVWDGKVVVTESGNSGYSSPQLRGHQGRRHRGAVPGRRHHGSPLRGLYRSRGGPDDGGPGLRGGHPAGRGRLLHLHLPAGG